jgi:sec-independent protein translocase protein TatB
MFNMGAGELILIAVIAIIFIPPDKLPKAATTLGKYFNQVRNSFQEIKSSIDVNVKNEVKKTLTTSRARINQTETDKKLEPSLEDNHDQPTKNSD